MTEFIQGIAVKSSYELNVANALYRLKHRFLYQWEVMGGTRVRGGMVVDFLVLTTVPLSTPILVHGNYWHKGMMGSEDKFKLAMLEQELMGQANPVLLIWGEVASDADKTYAFLRREIGQA